MNHDVLLDEPVRRSMFRALLSAKARNSAEIAPEDFLIAICEALGESASDLFDPPEALPQLISKILGVTPESLKLALEESKSRLIRESQKAERAVESQQVEGVVWASLKYSSDLEKVIEAGITVAREQSARSVSLSLDDIIQAFRITGSIDAISQRYGIPFTLAHSLAKKPRDTGSHTRSGESQTENSLTLEELTSLLDTWMKQSRLLHLSFVPGKSSPAACLGARFVLVGRVKLISPPGLVRIDGESGESLIDLRGGSFRYWKQILGAEAAASSQEGRTLVQVSLKLATGDTCILIADGE